MAKKIVPSKNGKQNSGIVTGGSSSLGKPIVVPELEALAGRMHSRMTQLTDGHIAVLKAYHGRVPLKAIAEHLGVNISKVSRAAQKLGLGGCR
jgi:hypothetical protein